MLFAAAAKQMRRRQSIVVKLHRLKTFLMQEGEPGFDGLCRSRIRREDSNSCNPPRAIAYTIHCAFKPFPESSFIGFKDDQQQSIGGLNCFLGIGAKQCAELEGRKTRAKRQINVFWH